MAKKVNATFRATLRKNTEKGGAWLGIVSVSDEGVDEFVAREQDAFSNASAGKRWIKERVIALTPRKSVKMIAGTKLDAKDKPVFFSGELAFKREI